MGQMKFFPAFFSYRRTLSGLTDAQIGRVFLAALQYAEDGTVPELDSIEALGFQFIKEDIDRARDHYDTVCERRREAINKRWSSRDETAGDTKEYNSIEKNTIDSKAKEKEKEKEKENVIYAAEAAAFAKKKPEKKKFVPPTVDEVRAYCDAQGYSTIDPEGFIDYYEANGWKVGSQSMKDWRATVRNWARRDKERGAQNKRSDSHASGGYFGENNGTFSNDNSSFDTGDFWAAAVAASYADMEGDG